MIVYQYDPETGMHSGNMKAQESPREPNVYLIPANSTSQKPPQTGERECVVYESGKWVLKPDYRGVTYYLADGTEHTIDVIDVVPPENALFEKPVIAPTFEDAKAAKLTEINSACDSILNAAASDYPASEIQTFSQQTTEAQVYVLDKTTSVPLLRALACARGIDLNELVARVLAKHETFSMLSGLVIGQRQAFEDKLHECKTLKDVQAIAVNFTLPEVRE